MPRNGRSARAGAGRTAGFFSGKGNGALCSLAAAADGGVTVELGRGEVGRIGRAPKKRQLAVIDKVRKQEADMRDCARRRTALPIIHLILRSAHFARVSKDWPHTPPSS